MCSSDLLDMVKHNNVIPNVHLHKDWQNRVKTWFDQAGRKQRRRSNRVKKALAAGPRPVAGAVRPAVRCQTIRYNTKVRLGRGFTLDEIKAAGLTAAYARTVGIAVDHRRKNRNTNALQDNVVRLKEYLSKLVVFPTHGKKQTKGETAAAEARKVPQLTARVIMPLTAGARPLETRAITEADRKGSKYQKWTTAQADAKLVGIRMKRAAEKAEKAKQEALKKAKGK